METLEDIKKAIMDDSQNQAYTKRGIEPLFAAPKTARINIVGQAPGIKAQETRLYWNDKSGDRLREWMGVDYDTFYHSGYFAAIPMDFYFPGHGKSGDLPPRKGFAEKWHQQIFRIVTRSGINYSYWPICSEVLSSSKGNCKVNRYGKTLSRLFARIFPTCSPISTKSNLAGQESLVCRASDTRFAGECSTDYFKMSTCSSFF